MNQTKYIKITDQSDVETYQNHHAKHMDIDNQGSKCISRIIV